MIELDSTDEMMEVDTLVTPVTGSRKVTKSAMEKKRRARINTSLTELKTMLSGIIQIKGERFDKMEKADILEWTVKYIKDLQNGIVGDQDIPSDDKYRVGFNSCVGEVLNYIRSHNSYDPEIRVKMLNHLADRVSAIDTSSSQRRCSSTDVSPSPRRCSSESPQPANDFATLPLVYKQPERFTQLHEHHVDADCNNNAQSIPNLNCNQRINQTIAESPEHNQSSGNQSTQLSQVMQSPLMPTGQITILVPANILGSPEGTNCLIPVAVPSYSPNSQAILVPGAHGDHHQQQQLQQQQLSPVYQSIQPANITPVYVQTDKQETQMKPSLQSDYSVHTQSYMQQTQPPPDRISETKQHVAEVAANNREYMTSQTNTQHTDNQTVYPTKQTPVTGNGIHVTKYERQSTVYPRVNCSGHRVPTDVWRPW